MGNHKNIKLRTFLLVLSFIFLSLYFCFLQNTSAQNQETLSNKAALLLSPRIETVLVGSTFDVSFFLDTRGNNINIVELHIKFPPDKLNIVSPSGDKSFFSVWFEAPTYSNVEGTANFLGGITNGITTGNGLVTTITFRAKTTGQAFVEVLPSSKVLANDALGTNILSEFGRGIYTINAKPPEGVTVFSKTHPSEDRWYINNNPILTWEKDTGVIDFSYELNDKPQTIPDNIADSQDTIKSYENVGDGVRYFHIKARKDGIWGLTTHFPLYIDTTSPLSFRPKIEVLTATIINRALVSFSTTDLLSGIDHYEVGIIDKTKSPLESPSFIEAESPYQLPTFISGNLRVIVRAVDRAGNVKDESADIYLPFSLANLIGSSFKIFSASTKTVFVIILAIIFLLVIIRYLFRNRIITRLWKRNSNVKNESNKF